MPPQGTFDVLSFADVVELLAAREMTGRLHVSGGAGTGSIQGAASRDQLDRT
jgi:hypothetical protein